MSTTVPQILSQQHRPGGRWCCLGLIALSACLSACSSEDDGSDDGSNSPSGGGVCFTANLTNTVAGEKTNAAMCVGLAYQDTYSCSFNSFENRTYCVGNSTGYWVEWVGAAYGNAYDGFDGSLMAQLGQGSTGAYVIDWMDGDHGECSVTGDVARLCMD